jgi:hypothetical protein
MERSQMTFYASFWDAINSLSKKDQLPVLRAVISYGLNGYHEETLSQSQNAFFTLMQPNLDASRKKAASGKHGGSKPKANEKQTAREGERENEKENEIENECYMGQPVVCLPLVGGGEYGVQQTLVDEFSSLYPAVDVLQELRNMRGWLLANPANRKTASGIKRFMNTWLSKEQNRARPAKSGKPAPAQRQMDDDEVAAIRRMMEVEL